MLRLLIRKVMKKIGTIAPTNFLRVLAFRLAGYRIGKDVWIGQGLIVIDDSLQSERLYIGDRVAIAPRVTIILQSFPNNSYIGQIIPVNKGDVIIKQDAWIGTGAIIMPNIVIGQASVVGAGSIVTKSIDEEIIVVGNPAKYLRALGSELEEAVATWQDDILGESESGSKTLN